MRTHPSAMPRLARDLQGSFPKPVIVAKGDPLAAALATGEKKTVPDGREVTLIGGRWYFSDVKDASSFLTEHGAKPKAEAKKATVPTMDRATIMTKLEERLAMGEISEETYDKLRKKYE